MSQASWRLALRTVMLVACIALFVPAVHGQATGLAADEAPVTAADPSDDSAMPDDPDAVDEQANDPQDDTVDDATDDATADADADAADPVANDLVAEDWTPVPMGDDETWAADIDEDPADDAIPVDTDLDPSGADWQVFDDDIVSDYSEDVNAVEQDGIRTPGDLPMVRRAQPGAAKPVTGRPASISTRPATTRPGDDDDVTYSTGGKPIRDHGAPWQAQIYYPKSAPQWADKLKRGTPLWQLQHYCGGSLIADDWVLTAAHCIDDDMVRAGYRVRLGVDNIQDPAAGWSYKIDRIVRHSRYADESLPKSPNRYANDIALVHIVNDQKLPARDPARVHPIALYTEPLRGGTQVAATGWGKTEAVAGAAPSAVLMRVDLRVMDNERCSLLPGYGPQKISGSVICAANPQKSTCQGDSGGGLTLASGEPRVVGVVSWGKRKCSGDGQPGAYTRIASYQAWIQQAMALSPARSSLP